ncbi:GH25 family lysozyme [Amycolatopsis sp. CA-126428]|uniref:GH25 family lysozyme n=1 Tax=Amycolatopsis sp. CA-126428 TaxID=2073158 RepID=UPI000CD1F51C|nr:GH25 family lysozyme [Amycolatopsis sp. CA-126428]
MALIIDLYKKYNPVTNWTALRGAVDAAYIKYSDGLGPAQVPADDYVAGCRASGIPYGGYHFAQPGAPAAQARAFLGQYRRLGGQLAPALDLETAGIPYAARPAFARTFLETVHQAYPLVVLYASASWLASLRPDTWPYAWDRTWCAAYGPNDGARHTITSYSGLVDLHQYTSRGRVPGVSGSVDLDHTDNLSALLLTGADSGDEPEEDAMPAIPHDYQGTGRDSGGKLLERCHVFTVPVGSVSTVVERAWLSFKCAIGPAESVRLMAISSGAKPGYPIDKTWTSVAADAARPYIEAPGGVDQFTAFVKSEFPYSLCVETKAKKS